MAVGEWYAVRTTCKIYCNHMNLLVGVVNHIMLNMPALSDDGVKRSLNYQTDLIKVSLYLAASVATSASVAVCFNLLITL